MSDESPKKSGLGKLIATLVIGGAVGSVVGMALAPQEGKKTRAAIKKTALQAVKKGKEFLDEHEEEITQVKQGGKKIIQTLLQKLLEK